MIVLFCIPSEQKPQEPGHRQHLMAPQSKPAPGPPCTTVLGEPFITGNTLEVNFNLTIQNEWQ